MSWSNDAMICNDANVWFLVLMLFNDYWLLIIGGNLKHATKPYTYLTPKDLDLVLYWDDLVRRPEIHGIRPKAVFSASEHFLTITGSSFYRPKVDSCRFIKHELLWSIVIYVNLCYIRKSWHLLTCFWFFANLANLALGIAFKKPITAHTHTHTKLNEWPRWPRVKVETFTLVHLAKL